MYFTKIDRRLAGNFYEVSKSAGLYRAEQLGLCAIHFRIAGVGGFGKVKDWYTTMCYNNKAAISLSARRLPRIRPGSSCANILRIIRSSRNRTMVGIQYEHVNGHMD